MRPQRILIHKTTTTNHIAFTLTNKTKPDTAIISVSSTVGELCYAATYKRSNSSTTPFGASSSARTATADEYRLFHRRDLVLRANYIIIIIVVVLIIVVVVVLANNNQHMHNNNGNVITFRIYSTST
jgi:hypothetical protein